MNKLRFDPKISLDGVAIIGAIIFAAIAWGRLSERVEETEKTVATHTQQLKQMADTTAKLTTLIDERTQRGGQ